ncbi:MAG: cellulose-binding protein [Pseudomonadota bacterium]
MNAARRRCTSVSTTRKTLGHGRITIVGSVFLLSACLGIVGCSSDSSPNGSASGGSHAGSGGAPASAGATTGSAGKSEAAGGTSGANNAAGSPSTAGGAATTGGSQAAGGTSASAGSGGSLATAGATTGGAGTGTQLVENQSADCEVGTLPEPSALPQIPKLPDPFMKLDGKRVATKAEWRCRRQEIRKQAEKYILGAKPTPDVVTGTVSNTSISVHVEAKGKSIDFTAKVVLPSKGQAPFPAMISVGNSLNLGESRMLDQGVAVIYYDNYALGKEGTAEMSRGKPNPGKYYDIYGGDDPAGLLIAWAWGASRMLDVIQKSGSAIIDINGIGVSGCSRLGKGAFTIGVFDDRIALTIPQEPSTGGDPALRIMDKISGAERTDYNYNGLNWLSNNFAPFVFANNVSNAVKLPIDTHALIGMIAPRGLLILENPHQTQMGAPAGHTAAIAGLEVYKALGVEKNISYHSSVADTAHCSYKPEYTDLINKNIAAFLKHTGDAPGQFLVGSGGSLTRSDWIDWQAPTLQ